MPPIAVLEGPVAAYCVKGFNRCVWVFGDEHVWKDDALRLQSSPDTPLTGRLGRLEQFISEEALRLNDSPLYVILEASETHYDVQRVDKDWMFKEEVGNYMSSLELFLRGCVRRRTSHGDDWSCYYPNVRLVGTDTRQSDHLFNKLYRMVTRVRVPDHILKRVRSTVQVYKVLHNSDPADVAEALEAIREYKSLGCGTLRDVVWSTLVNNGYTEMLASVPVEAHRTRVDELVQKKLSETYSLRMPLDHLEGVLERFHGSLVDHYDNNSLSDTDVFDLAFFSASFSDDGCLVMDACTLCKLLGPDKERVVLFVGVQHARLYYSVLCDCGFQSLFEHHASVKDDFNSQLIDFHSAPYPYVEPT